MRRAEIVVVLLAATVAAASGCGRSDPPRLKVSRLPPSAATSAVEARFQLRNVGGRPLGLDDVVPACGCVPTSHLPEALASGASTTLDVRCRVPRGAGDVVRALRLRTNDPANPETSLSVTLTGSGTGPDPAALYFGYVALGTEAAREVVVPAALGELPVPAHADFAVESLPARADGALRVRVRFTPRTAGVVRATLDLGPAGGRLPVTAVGYGELMAFPAEVRVPRPSGAAGLPSITLVARGDRPAAFGRIDYPAGITGELRTVVPGKQFRLVLRGRGSDLPRDAAIRVHAAATGEPMLAIPVVNAVAGDLAGPAT
jgi:hypothetical protein